MLANVRKFTYLSAAKNSNKEYLTEVSIKSEIITPFRGNLLRKQGFLCALHMMKRIGLISLFIMAMCYCFFIVNSTF